MVDLTMISYTTLAPLSVICEATLLYGFIRLRQIKEHPEILIFWQCLSQLIMDIHWFTGIDSVRSYMSDFSCCFLGAFCIYFYFLSWDYTTLLSIEIFIKIQNPHDTNYKKRRMWYHYVSHLTSLGVFLGLVLGGNNNGKSIMSTCFVEARSIYELVVMIPAFIHFPICAVMTGYTWYNSYGTFYLSYLKYHMLVIVAFSIGWVPIAIVHGLNYSGFNITVPEWFVMIAVFLGGPSGALIFIARMMQKGLLSKIIDSILHPKRFSNSLCAELRPEKICEVKVGTYADFFTSVTVRAIADILLGISSVMINSENTVLEGQDHREWNFTSLVSGSGKFIITQYNIAEYEKIMKHSGMKYEDIYQSLNASQNFFDIESRCKNIGGRSGAFFYYTFDNDFILKTVTEEELVVLKSMIKDYSKRIITPPYSYLAKIFGAYKIKTEHSKPFRVILMENLSSRLETPLIFDMKGSKLDRRVTKTSYADADCMPRNKVYKDVDFFNVIHNFQLDGVELPGLINCIKLDVKLLEKYSIMDYSLLLLLEERSFLNGSIVQGTNFFKFGKYLVFIGLIDFLQTFNMKKKIEQGYKVLKVSKADEVSAIAPKPYRKRFMKLLRQVFRIAQIN